MKLLGQTGPVVAGVVVDVFYDEERLPYPIVLRTRVVDEEETEDEERDFDEIALSHQELVTVGILVAEHLERKNNED